MSLHPVDPADIKSLDWDPSVTNPEPGETSRFAWAIDHESQGNKPTWCWAVCLRNALTSIGRYLTKEEIRNGFFRRKPLNADERIPTPEGAVDLWRSFGYVQAEKPSRDETLLFEDLAWEIATHGPVQIELWGEEENPEKPNSHLALIYGIIEAADGRKMVCVSNPASQVTELYPYSEIKDGGDPLGSNYGKWRRTYFHRGNNRELRYLRRFVGCPTKYLARVDNNADITTDRSSRLNIERSKTKLTLEKLQKLGPLRKELALASYGFRYYRYHGALERGRERREAELKQRLFLLESIRVWKPRPRARIDYEKILMPDQFEKHCWHHQIYDINGPRYYARTHYEARQGRPGYGGWRTSWMGERWAKPVDDALRQLERDSGDLQQEEEVRMMWLKRKGLVTLHLARRNLHMVVISPWKHRDVLTPLKTFTDEELRAVLRDL